MKQNLIFIYNNKTKNYKWNNLADLSTRFILDQLSTEKNIISPEIQANQIEKQLANLDLITFEVTDACNLKCKYCGYGELYSNKDKRDNKNLSLDVAKQLLDYLSRFWHSTSNLSKNRPIQVSFYGGEPLLNMPFIREIVFYTESMPIFRDYFNYGLTTNALLIDKYMDYLVEKQFKLLISLDGNEKNHSYRVTRSGKNSFNKVLTNIKLLQNRHPQFFDKYVQINAVLHNLNSVDHIYEYIKKEFNKVPNISELNIVGIAKDKKELFLSLFKNKRESLYQAEHYEEILPDLFFGSPDIQSLTHFLHHYSGNVFKTYKDLLYGNDHKKYSPSGTCLPFSRKIFVTVNGKILPCERIGQQYSLGQVTSSGVHLDFNEIANLYKAWFEKIYSQCSLCYRYKSCVQCIFNLDELAENPVCFGFTNRLQFEKYVSSQIHFLEKHPTLYNRIMEEIIIS